MQLARRAVGGLTTRVRSLAWRTLAGAWAPLSTEIDTLSTQASGWAMWSLRLWAAALAAIAWMLWLMASSVALYLLLYSWMVPAYHAALPVHFDVSTTAPSIPPEATVMLQSMRQWRYADVPGLDGLDAAKSRYLSPGHQYNAYLDLSFPDSSVNHDCGMQSVEMIVLHEQTMLASSLQSFTPRYTSPLVKWMWSWAWALPLVTGVVHEQQHISMHLFDALTEQEVYPTTAIKIRLKSPTAHRFQLYSATLRLQVQLSGMRYLMYHWPLSTGLMIVSLIFSFQLFWSAVLLAVVYLWCYGGAGGGDEEEEEQQEEAAAAAERDRLEREQLRQQRKESDGVAALSFDEDFAATEGALQRPLWQQQDAAYGRTGGRRFREGQSRPRSRSHSRSGSQSRSRSRSRSRSPFYAHSHSSSRRGLQTQSQRRTPPRRERPSVSGSRSGGGSALPAPASASTAAGSIAALPPPPRMKQEEGRRSAEEAYEDEAEYASLCSSSSSSDGDDFPAKLEPPSPPSPVHVQVAVKREQASGSMAVPHLYESSPRSPATPVPGPTQLRQRNKHRTPSSSSSSSSLTSSAAAVSSSAARGVSAASATPTAAVAATPAAAHVPHQLTRVELQQLEGRAPAFVPLDPSDPGPSGLHSHSHAQQSHAHSPARSRAHSHEST